MVGVLEVGVEGTVAGGEARNCGIEIVGVGVAAADLRTVMIWLICGGRLVWGIIVGEGIGSVLGLGSRLCLRSVVRRIS